MSSRWDSTPRRTDWPTFGRNVSLTLTLTLTLTLHTSTLGWRQHLLPAYKHLRRSNWFLSVCEDKFVRVLNSCNTTPYRRTYLGTEAIAPRIHNFFTLKKLVISLMFRPLYSRRKGRGYPLDRMLDGPQGRSGEEIVSSPCRESNPDCSAI
jgi:hypothetical protein